MMDAVLNFIDKVAAKADIPGFNWVRLLVVLLIVHNAFEGLVDYRQSRILENDTIPPQVKDYVNKEEMEKSRKYDKAKLQFKNWSRLFKLALNIFWYHFLLLSQEWSIAETLVSKIGSQRFSGEITKAVVFINVSGIISALIDIPFDIYYQFVLEEKFGFNKSTFSLYVTDFFKKQLISIVMNSILIAGLGKVVEIFGNAFFIYAAVFIVIFILVFSVAHPLVIDPLFNKFEPLEDGELKNAINALAKKLNFPLTRIYVQDSSKRTAHSNAYFIGLPWYKQIVLFDNLIKTSTTEEIVAVLGHELGHWKLNHVTKHLALNSLIVIFVFILFAVFINNASMYQALGFSEPHWIIGFVIFSDIMTPAQAPLKFLLTYTIRKHEYDADEFSVNLGYGEELKRGLVVLNKENLSTLHADPLYAAYHHSHPILPTRLTALERYISVFNAKTK